uniref:Uncharacterized protein n=1 Tax=Glycine max TaxID=3847 RepID=A0A0R0GGQ8_SOYBN
MKGKKIKVQSNKLLSEKSYKPYHGISRHGLVHRLFIPVSLPNRKITAYISNHTSISSIVVYIEKL